MGLGAEGAWPTVLGGIQTVKSKLSMQLGM